MGKILVIRGGAIGDFILTLPVLSALRDQFPDARIEVLGYAHIAGLARAGGLVDEVRSIEAAGLAGFFARGGTLDEDLMDYFSGFAVILSYLYDPDGVFQANVGRSSRAQFIQGPHRPDDAGDVPASEVFLEPLTRLAIFDMDPVPRLAIAASKLGEGEARGAGGKRLLVHAGSGSERKNWPEERWREFLSRVVLETEWELLMVSGEAEGERVKRLSSQLPASRHRRAHNVPLPELARVVRGCDLFVGHDSGISHLAAALGLGGLVLWGESVERVWRPPSGDVVVVRSSEGLPGLEASEVFARVLERIRRGKRKAGGI